MEIDLKPAYHLQEEIGHLFSEYTNLLTASDPAFQKYLEIQNYDDELAHLDKKYGPPDGRLYAAFWDEQVAGCIALRRLDKQGCEMKRLYVRPAFQGKGIGRSLVERIIADAKEIGYAYMLLDTLPFLDKALSLYRDYGFYEIDSYNNNPIKTSIYMRLDL